MNGQLYVDQGIIAGCAGGGFENICAAADIIKGHYIGSDEFTFSVYPASTPIYMELVKNGAVADLMEAGTIVTQPETSRTVKALSFRADRSHPLHLWMHVPSQQQQQIRDSLHLQLTWMWNTKDRNITLTKIFTQTVSSTATA